MSEGVVATAATSVPETGTKVRLLGDRVLVLELEAASTTMSGILIPEVARQGTQRGIILATGPGPRSPFTADIVDMGLKQGDHVMFAQMAGAEMVVDGKSLLVLREADIICVYSPAEPLAEADETIPGQLDLTADDDAE